MSNAARKHPVLPVLVVATSLCLGGTTGCDDPSIDEQRIPKGAEPAAPASPATAPATQPNETTAQPSAPSEPGGGTGAPAASADTPWTVPAGWTLSPEPRPMRLATFTAQTQAGPIDIAVTRFEGDTGGTLANVNRWRGQMGLAQVDAAGLDAAITRFGSESWPGYTLRVDGAEQSMLAAGVFEASANRTWFARATGAPAAIDAIEPDFAAFIRSFGHPGTP